MPTIADKSLVNIHYGDLNEDTGVIGGHMVNDTRYSFLIDRGYGVEHPDIPGKGFGIYHEVQLMFEDRIVAHLKRGAPNEGTRIAPTTYRDWAMLQQLELSLSYSPASEKTSDKEKKSFREQFQKNSKDSERDRD